MSKKELLKEYDVLTSPVITEKSTNLSSLRKYVFKVPVSASKPIIKTAVEKLFSVEVLSVNIININGKVKKFRGTLGKRSDVRKAIVTLKKDFELDYTGGVK